MIKLDGQEATQNDKGHWVVDNKLASVDGVKLMKGAEFAYTREEIMAMIVAQLDEVEKPLEIEGYYDMLKAEKQTAILEALGL